MEVRKIVKKVVAALIKVAFPELYTRGISAVYAMEQLNLVAQYKRLYLTDSSPLLFKDVGFRAHSQYEEDGILLFIFSLIGTTNKECVEIAAGNGVECNTANLIINHRWIGLLVDGQEENIRIAKRYYSNNYDTKCWPPVIKKEWITKDNVNSIIESSGFRGNIDLLSLDIDGMDYWVWDSISCVSPRVVVLEFNHLCGPDIAVTVPYKENFVAEFTRYGSDYAGASLKAFVELGKKKKYRFVGTNAIATNAFFIRDDIECDWLPEKDIHSCFDHPRARFGMEERWQKVKDKEWQRV